MELTIREGTERDFPAVTEFYDLINQDLWKREFLSEKYSGGFPPQDMIREGIRLRGLYLALEGERIVAAGILNHSAEPAYDSVRWQVAAPKEQITVFHALRVRPDRGRRGIAGRLVEHIVEAERQKGRRAIRLDCLIENRPAAELYRSRGFEHVDTVEMLYEDIGEWRRFLMFEKEL